MAEIRAFRGFRYDLGRVGALSDVVAPPYDVIGPALQRSLHGRSPHNSIRLELSEDRPGDTEQDNRYTRAARTLRDWLAEDVLVQDSSRCLYAYEQEFEAEGERFSRRGFIARVRLVPFGEGVFPHEETMGGPKKDRLSLFRATGMNVSPVFGLYPDDANEVFEPLARLLPKMPPLEARDDLGVTHRLWPVTDLTAIGQVAERIGPKPVFIADGHHRYETGLEYLRERREAGEAEGDDAPAGFVMMMLVSMNDPGLAILPTHRLVSGLPGLDAAGLSAALAGHFEVERAGEGDAGMREAWDWVQADGSQSALAFGTPADGAWLTARLTRPEAMAELAGNRSPAWRELAVSVLHVLVLGHLLKQPAPSCTYVHLLDEVREGMSGGVCDMAALVPPAGMGHLRRVAEGLERMPAKSTYFYPKLATGLVFNSLKTN